MNHPTPITAPRSIWTCALVMTLGLTACGGQAGVGGTVNGLANGQTLVLQNNAETLSIVGSSATSLSFSFATTIASGSTYNTIVSTQPAGQNCTVSNGSGTIDVNGSGVSNIVVTCTTTASVIASVSGLKSGRSVELATNNQSVTANANGSFGFPNVIQAPATYNVVVSKQPSDQTCTVTNPTGTVVSGTPFTVAVTCV